MPAKRMDHKTLGRRELIFAGKKYIYTGKDQEGYSLNTNSGHL